MSTTAVVWTIICFVLLAIAAGELYQATKDRDAQIDPASKELAGQHVIMGIFDLATIGFFLLTAFASTLERHAVAPFVISALHWTVIVSLFAGLSCFGARMFWQRRTRHRVIAAQEPNSMETLIEDIYKRVQKIEREALGDRSAASEDRIAAAEDQEQGRRHRGADAGGAGES